MKYELIRSKRKTLAVQVDRNGNVSVRAPMRLPEKQIKAFLEEKADWIAKTQRKMQMTIETREEISLTHDELSRTTAMLHGYLHERVPEFAKAMNVDYLSIHVSKANTRWGSCSHDGKLRFSYKLAFAPVELADYVIVHELAHRKEMNHSQRFWSVVAEAMPDYKQRRKDLKKYGREIQIMIK